MIMTVAEFRHFVKTDEEDQVLEAKLQALELLIRAYTNNNFQVRAFRDVAVAQADHELLFKGKVPFAVGDITASEGMITLLPHVHETDGFFVALLEKTSF